MKKQDGMICVCGDPVSAWLTATVIVRFTGIHPHQVMVKEQGVWISETILVRPETARLHKSIGLNVAELPNAKRIGYWKTGDKHIPLSPFGSPLKSAAFQHIWTRAQQTLDVGRLWSYNSMQPVPDMFEVPADLYVQAVKRIATNVGIPDRANHSHQPTITIESGQACDRDAKEDDVIRVGYALTPDRLASDLHLYILDISLRTLMANWPGLRNSGPEVREYQRRMSEVMDLFSQMQALLDDEPKSDVQLEHRINVWRALGRIVPVDSDPFTEQEWIAALLHAGHAPVGYPHIHDAISEADVEQHLSRCVVREAGHGP